MTRRILLTLSLLGAGCHPSVEDWLESAKLAEENNMADKAEVFRHHAYEESLPADFLVLGRKEKFLSIKSAANGKMVALLGKKNSKEKNQEVVFYDFNEDDSYRFTVKIPLRDVFISPQGKFGLFYYNKPQNKSQNNNDETTVKKASKKKIEKKCFIELLVIEKEKRIFTDTLAALELNCNVLPAVDDLGNIIISEENRIFIIEDRGNKKTSWHEKKKIDFRLSKIPLVYRFEAIGPKVYYMTVGNAGSYVMYKFEETAWQKFSLIQPSSSRVYFSQDMTMAGVISGGADNFTLSMFSVSDASKNKLAIKISNWNEFSFYSDLQYYYIHDKKLHAVINGQTRQLPFLAEHLQSIDKDSIFILSRLGTLIQIKLADLKLITPASLAIFEKLKLE